MIVHNHGIDPTCPERIVDGNLRGACLDVVTVSHDPRDWREAFETSEPGPELNRLRDYYAAVHTDRLRQSAEAVMHLADREAQQWRKRALEAEERAEELSRVAATLTEREAAATRENKRLRLLLEDVGA